MAGQFIEHELGRHQAVLLALAHHLSRLLECAWNLAEPGNVILVVLRGIQRHAQGQIGQPRVDAVLLIHGHFIILKAVVHVLSLDLSLHDPMAQQVLVAHPIGRDRLKPLQEIIGFCMLARDFGQRILIKQRVVTVIAKRRRSLRRILQACLIKFLKQRILLCHAIGHWRHFPKRGGCQAQDKTANNMSHMQT